MHGILGFDIDDLFARSFEGGKQAMKSLFGRGPAHAVRSERHEAFLETLGWFMPRVP